ncbi:hypothetical protein C8R45DRAFT_975637 [Mycena sanguinolenta]|nr:hypothetical protein C8R45DRAFT_975637 [Mycena sanguinolenta]
MRDIHIWTCEADLDFLHENWDTRDQFILPINAQRPLVALYTELLDFCADHAQRGWRLFADLFQNLGIEEPAAEVDAFFTSPPQIVVVKHPSAYGCHARAEHLREYILVDPTLCCTMELGQDQLSTQALAAYEVMKATVIRELAHVAVFKVVGASKPELYNVAFQQPTKVLSPEHISSLKALAIIEGRQLITPEKLAAPWNISGNGEAGEWVEYRAFGGVMTYCRRRRVALLQTARNTYHELTREQLNHGRCDTLVNFMDHYPDLHPPTISPSPSGAQNTRRRKADDGESVGIASAKCPGPLFQVRKFQADLC